jgi:hypothetical protein
MSLTPSVFALLTALLFSVGAGGIAQESRLSMAQLAARLLALQHAELLLTQAADMLAVDGANGTGRSDPSWRGVIETLPVLQDASAAALPPVLQRVTVVGESGTARVRLQADFAVYGCESALDPACVARVARLAWRQLPLE